MSQINNKPDISFLYIIILLLFNSCLIPKKSYHTKVIYFDLNKKPVMTIQLPTGFKQKIEGGSHGTFFYFYYPDSSVVYIDGETFYGLNYDNIKETDQYYELQNKYHSNDSITISGEDRNKLYWKNVVLQQYSIGYINAPLTRKLEFDNSLTTIKFMKKIK